MSKFAKMERHVEKEGYGAKSARKIAAAIGRKKYGSKKMGEKAAASRKRHEK